MSRTAGLQAGGVDPATGANTPRGSARGVRNASVYAISAASQRALAFLLLPLYTRTLDPAQYGRLSVLLTIAAGTVVVFSCGFEFSVIRGFFDRAGAPDRQQTYISTLWAFLLWTSLGGTFVVTVAVVPWLPTGGVVRPDELALALLGAGLYVAATTVPLAVLRAQERIGTYLVLSAIAGVATASLTVLAVVVLDLGVVGWTAAVVLANAVILAAAMAMIPWRRPRPFARADVRGAVSFGLPLVPHFLSHWGLQLADRAVLAILVPTSVLGVYAFAATLATPAMILVTSLCQGFLPSYTAARDDHAAVARLQAIVTLQVALGLMICLAAALLLPCLVSLVAPPAYAGADRLIPWLVLGYAFLNLYYPPMNGLSMGAGRTGTIWTATAGAAAVNILVILVFVPRYGIEAAAVASAAGYLVLLLAVWWQSRCPENPVVYDWRRLAATAVAVAAAYAGATLVSGHTNTVDATIRIVFVGLTAVGLGAIGALPVAGAISRLRKGLRV